MAEMAAVDYTRYGFVRLHRRTGEPLHIVPVATTATRTTDAPTLCGIGGDWSTIFATTASAPVCGRCARAYRRREADAAAQAALRALPASFYAGTWDDGNAPTG